MKACALRDAIPDWEWQARRDSNPQPAVLETAALPIEPLAYCVTGRHIICTSLPDRNPYFLINPKKIRQ